MTEKQYDIAIIGAGPGGYHAAIRGAQYGAKVALIEKDKLGGTCLHRGCIPTKSLYASAHLIEKIKEAEDFGIEIPHYKTSFAKAIARKNRIVKELEEGIIGLQKGWKNDIYMGHGKILSGNIEDGFEVSIEKEEEDFKIIKAKRVIIATGSSPALIPAFKIDHERVLTSDDILNPNFNTISERIIIVGAGVIGCEFANIFATFGSKVEIIEFLPNPIATEEPMIIKLIQKKLEVLGIVIHLSQAVISVENTGFGVKVIACSADIPRDQRADAEKFIYEADLCLISIGRAKESDNLGLEKIGVETERGAIKVNPSTLETGVEGIYAIGDVVGGVMLAHVASHEGDVAVANALASLGNFPVNSTTIDYDVLPATIFTSPNIGSVGLRRKQAKEKGIDVLMGQFPFSALGKAKCMGEEEGFIMILADKKDYRIIGASCIGTAAPELISEIALAMKHGLTVHDIGKTIHSHPTISEMVLEGSEAVVGKAVHKKGRPIHPKIHYSY